MRYLCAVCKAELRPADDTPPLDATSHGYCPACLRDQLDKAVTVSAKPACKHCHGRGHSGWDDDGQRVVCRCVLRTAPRGRPFSVMPTVRRQA